MRDKEEKKIKQRRRGLGCVGRLRYNFRKDFPGRPHLNKDLEVVRPLSKSILQRGTSRCKHLRMLVLVDTE